MTTTLRECASLLTEQRLRHCIDAEDGVIRLLFATTAYRNRRDEPFAIVTIDAPDEGRRLRASIRHAFPVTEDAAGLCLTACRLAAEMPLVGAEYDADDDELRLVCEMPVEDAVPTRRQVVALVDRLLDAAEQLQLSLDWLRAADHGMRRRPDAA